MKWFWAAGSVGFYLLALYILVFRVNGVDAIDRIILMMVWIEAAFYNVSRLKRDLKETNS